MKTARKRGGITTKSGNNFGNCSAKRRIKNKTFTEISAGHEYHKLLLKTPGRGKMPLSVVQIRRPISHGASNKKRPSVNAI